MPTIRKLLKSATKRLELVGIVTARLDARVLLEHILDVNHSYIITHNTQLVNKENAEKYDGVLKQREERQPIASIVGHREFWSIDFKTTTNTLDPRPDSETLVEAVMKARDDRAKSYKILDLGTGTGCLILSLLSEYPNATGVAVDICDEALEIASHNAQELKMFDKMEFIKSNWCESVQGEFDIIISNPPYIPTQEIRDLEPEVTDYDPHLALDGGVDGLDDYRILAKQIKKILKKDGIMIFEFGIGQEDEIAQICSDAGLKSVKFEKDLAGITRCVVCVSRC